MSSSPDRKLAVKAGPKSEETRHRLRLSMIAGSPKCSGLKLFGVEKV